LAARNILLKANYEVKVSDFGFARVKTMEHDSNTTKSEVGPVKWMSPVRIFQEFSLFCVGKFIEKTVFFQVGCV
jgi:serine/threonine protein kinase